MSVVGQGTSIQIGKETTYATIAAATVKLHHNSESLKVEVESKAEETLLGNITEEDQDIHFMKVGGDVKTIVKPEASGLLLALAFGSEAAAVQVDTSTAYDHVLSPVDAGADLPSFTAEIDRHVHIKKYSGCKIGTLKLDFAQKDYLYATATIAGKKEETGTLTAALTAISKKAFRFAGGSLKVDSAAVAEGNAKGGSLTLNNNLTDSEATLSSGLYGDEVVQQNRDISLSLDVNFTTVTDGWRENKFLANADMNIELTFESVEEIESGKPYQLIISILKARITEDPSFNISGKDKITGSLNLKALEGSGAPITITLRDSLSTKYLA